MVQARYNGSIEAGTRPAEIPGSALGQALRDLIDLAQRGPAPSRVGTSDAPRSVLLDIEVDGVRCVLTRVTPEIGPSLSPREREIARMVADGYTNKTIAAVLEISTWTVSTHLRRIFAKLGVCSRAAMVARILQDRTFDRPTI